MMTNKEIALKFKLLADLMELYDENSFKIKSYANAYLVLRKITEPLIEMPIENINALPGVGKAISDKISSLKETGSFKTLDEFIHKTPAGIIQLLKVRGLGPKKVKSIWKELGVEDISELMLACNENRLVEVKGFGLKTQEDIKNKIEFFLSSSGKYHYASVIGIADKLLEKFNNLCPNEMHALSGGIKSKKEIVDSIEIISTADSSLLFDSIKNEEDENSFEGVKVVIIQSSREEFSKNIFFTTSSDEFKNKLKYIDEAKTEEEIFIKNNIPFIPYECREDDKVLKLAKEGRLDELIDEDDIKGVIHNHSTYSDGLNSIEEMAEYCIKLGYKYLVISDHSVSAFYANGLSIERVEQQWREIDQLNKKYQDFKVFKGIESDILNDGNLDYPKDILSQFDVIISSIHSNLKMDIDKATSRLITAIENPYTRILGHPTSRLLLGRNGYEIDHQKIIDACSENKVAIELNANPQRLDLDWRWIDYAMNKEVMISINPDAHSTGQINYIKFGVIAARKGGLIKRFCLNHLDTNSFEKWLDSK